MTRSDKRILWVGLVCLLFLAGWGTIHAILSLDAPPPDDADLRPARAEIPEDRNALASFNQAGEKVDVPFDAQEELEDILDGRRYDQAKVDDLLRRNAEALTLWRQGLARPALQAPRIDDIAADMGYCYSWLEIARLVDLSALSLCRQGKDDEAFHEAMSIVRFGRMVMGADGGLITFLIGKTVEEIGLVRLRRMIPQARLDKGQLALGVRELARPSPPGADLANALRVEYQVYAKSIDDLHSGNPLFGGGSAKSGGRRRRPVAAFALHVNRTKGMFAEVMRPCVENAAKPYAEMVWPERPARVRKSVSWLLWTFVTGNGIGKMVFAAMALDYTGCLEQKCTRNISVAATRLLLALKGYKMDKGRLPETLDELVPAYIEAVPPDDFDGRPFRYSASKKVIYSVGKNLTDDGGDDPAYDKIDELAYGEAEAPVEAKDLVFPILF